MMIKNLFLSTALVSSTLGISSGVIGAEVVRCLTEPIRDVEMSTIVPGTVAIIHYGEGSHVDEGDVILEMEARSEKLELQRRTVVEANLKSKLDRSESLLKSASNISMEEVDESRSEYEIAQLDLELAKEALNKKLIKAPFDGIVTELPIEVGEYCEPPRIIVRVVDTSQFFCVTNIDPGVAAGLKLGDTTVYRSGENDQRLSGKVVFISPVIDPASGLLRVEALFANSNGTVRPGEAGLLELSPRN